MEKCKWMRKWVFAHIGRHFRWKTIHSKWHIAYGSTKSRNNSHKFFSLFCNNFQAFGMTIKLFFVIVFIGISLAHLMNELWKYFRLPRRSKRNTKIRIATWCNVDWLRFISKKLWIWDIHRTHVCIYVCIDLCANTYRFLIDVFLSAVLMGLSWFVGAVYVKHAIGPLTISVKSFKWSNIEYIANTYKIICIWKDKNPRDPLLWHTQKQKHKSSSTKQSVKRLLKWKKYKKYFEKYFFWHQSSGLCLFVYFIPFGSTVIVVYLSFNYSLGANRFCENRCLLLCKMKFYFRISVRDMIVMNHARSVRISQ